MIKQFIVSSEAVGDQPRLPRRWSSYLALLLVVVGSALLLIGALMPAYTDPVAAERIISGQQCAPGVSNRDENFRCDSELWHRSMSALRTSKWRLVDGGGGLLVSGLMIVVFLWWNARNYRSHLLTAKKSLWILTLASLCWWMQIPAYQLFFLTEVARDYYPHWAGGGRSTVGTDLLGRPRPAACQCILDSRRGAVVGADRIVPDDRHSGWTDADGALALSGRVAGVLYTCSGVDTAPAAFGAAGT